MAKVFVSYSRRDIEFTKRLTEELQKSELEFWVDWEGIPPTVDFMKQIETGIEESDVFLFLLSPDSAKSKVCGEEVAHAIKHSKRLIPLVVRDVNSEEVPPALSHLNWVFFREQDDFGTAFKKLLLGINTDFDWVEAHRRLLVRALEWQRRNKDNSFLLRGQDLQDAESQLAINTSKDPHPTDLHREYILKSRQAADRQRRWTTIISVIAAVIMFALAIYGLNAAKTARTEADRANRNEQNEAIAKKLALAKEIEAKINQLSALAVSKIDQNFNEALLLSVEAYLHAKDNHTNDLNTQAAITQILQSKPGVVQILLGHTDWINVMALSPDGNILASGSWDESIILWDISKPAFPVNLKTIEEHTAPVESVTFSPDGKIMASSSNFELILWDITDPSNPKMLSKTDGHYTDLKFTQDNKALASLQINEDVVNFVVLFDVSNLKSPVEISRLETGDENVDMFNTLFAPDGNLLFASLSNGSILEWDVADLQKPELLSTLEGGTESSLRRSMAISPDGKKLAAGNPDSTIALWDISDPALPLMISTWSGHSQSVNSLAFSPDGTRLVSSSDDTLAQIVSWDISSAVPKKTGTINGHSLGVTSVLFDQSNSLLLSGSRDSTIMLWNIVSLKTDVVLGSINDPAKNIAFQPNSNTLLAVGTEGEFTTWDIANPSQPEKIKKQDGSIRFVFFSNDGKLMASMDLVKDNENTVTIWDAAKFSKLNTIKMNAESVSSVRFSADDKTLAIVGEKIIFWNINDPGKPVLLATLDHEPNEMTNVFFSPDGKLMASIADKNIILWDVSNPAAPTRLGTLEGHTKLIQTVAFSPANNSLLASAGKDRNIVLWNISDPRTPEIINTLASHSDWVNSIAFNPDGTMLASGSYDKQVNLWNIANPESPVLISKMTGHTSNVTKVAFNSSGEFLASLDSKQIIFWNIIPESWAQKACAITGNNLSPVQWNQFFPSEEYNPTCSAFNIVPEESTSLIPSIPATAPSESLLACTASQTPSCSPPAYDTTDLFCIDSGSYGLYTLDPDTSFEVLTPGFTCISEEVNSRGEPRISCTGPESTDFQVSFCNSTCTGALETSSQCQAGFGLNSAEGCCAPLSSISNGCVTETLILIECE